MSGHWGLYWQSEVIVNVDELSHHSPAREGYLRSRWCSTNASMTPRWSHLKRVPGECNVFEPLMSHCSLGCLGNPDLRHGNRGQSQKSHGESFGKSRASSPGTIFPIKSPSRNAPDLFTGILTLGITDDGFFPATSSGNVDLPLVFVAIDETT